MCLPSALSWAQGLDEDPPHWGRLCLTQPMASETPSQAHPQYRSPDAQAPHGQPRGHTPTILHCVLILTLPQSISPPCPPQVSPHHQVTYHSRGRLGLLLLSVNSLPSKTYTPWKEADLTLSLLPRISGIICPQGSQLPCDPGTSGHLACTDQPPPGPLLPAPADRPSLVVWAADLTQGPDNHCSSTQADTSPERPRSCIRGTEGPEGQRSVNR